MPGCRRHAKACRMNDVSARLLADEEEMRASLRRHKRLATGLLLLMAALVLVTYALPLGWPAELLQASAKAGVVGGIADWFAVTALFRHPLGLPIPHTAIIPRQKERLGRALGRFVAGHVFTGEDVRRGLSQLDLPAIVARFLSDPVSAGPAAAELSAMVPRLLATVEDGRARRLMGRLLPRVIGGPGAGRMLARALRSLVEGGRHQEVLTFILGQLRDVLDRKEGQLQAVIEEQVREKGGRLVGWALGAQIASRVMAALREEMIKMGPDDSPVRAAFDEWVRHEIERLETDPNRAAEIGAGLRRVVAHDTVQAWLWDVWARLRLAMESDAAKPNGHTAAFLAGALGNLGRFLENDEAARARLQAAAETVITRLMPAAQAPLANFVAEVVGRWDAEQIVDKLELRVGRDLQYVRFNGTLVGFLVGGVVYLLLDMIFPKFAL